MKAALQAKLRQLKAEDLEDQDVVVIAEVENEIEDIIYQQGNEVPYNLTDPEKLEFSNYIGEAPGQCVCPHLWAVHANIAR